MNISNNPPVILELTQQEAEFLKSNCDVNLEQGIVLLGSMADDASMRTLEKLVGYIEMFKSIRQKLDALDVPSRD